MLRLKFCLVVVLLLAGCTRNTTIPTDTLIVAIGAQPATLDPRLATDATGMRVCNLIFNSLTRLGPNLEAIPDASERWTYRDHKYTFHLRPDLRFHNGRAVNAADVEFSFEQYRRQGPFATSLDIITDVKAENSTQTPAHVIVHITLKNYSDKFLKSDLPAVKLLPKEEMDSSFSTKLIGTGGFRFIRQGPEGIELAAMTAKTKHLIFKLIRDDFTRFQKMLKGEIDIIQQELTPDKAPYFQKEPKRFQVHFYPGLSMSYILINLRDPVLQKLEVRQALARTLQRDELIKFKFYDQAQEATSILTPNNSYFNSQLSNLPYDLPWAQSTVKSLGLENHTLTLKTSNSPQAIENGKALAYQMKRSGLAVQIQSYEWGTFYSDVKRGGFQLATMRWVGTVDPDIYRLAFHSTERPPGRNRGSYQNPKLDRLLDEGTRAENVAIRKKIFLEVQKIVQDDLAIIPLWYDRQIAVARTVVKDYQPDQTGEYYSLLKAYKDNE